MSRNSSYRWVASAALAAFLSMGSLHSCNQFGVGSLFMFFQAPLFGQLSLPQGIGVELQLGALVDLDSVEVQLDGAPVDPALLSIVPGGGLLGNGSTAVGELPDLDEGQHIIAASAVVNLFFFSFPINAATGFDVTDLERPDECEILNNASCVLPFPSGRFLEDVGSETETGVRLNYPEWTIEGLVEPNPPLDPAPINVYDGFAPTTQVLVHLPGADPEASNASRLLPGVPQSAPYVGVRTHDLSSLDPDSPTVLLDVDTGERVLHWVEADDNPIAVADPSRQVLFLRPAQALVPGHRYIVAFRGMVDSDGSPIEPEDTFRNLRDRLPTTIEALEARRPDAEDIFHELWRAGVRRHDLQLAIDFVVRSEKQLHEKMLTMRDEALGWLDALAPDDISGIQNLVVTDFGDCSDPAQAIWRRASGTFDGPYYMDGNINVVTEFVLIELDPDGLPVRTGEFPFNWDVAVPCTVFRGEEVGHPLMLGHGFLGTGKSMVDGFVAGSFFGSSGPVSYIAGATDWRGLALGFTGPDTISLVLNVIGTPASGHRFNGFQALPDRLMQGVVNTLVLSRMMTGGYFNRLEAFQRTPGDPATGVFDDSAEPFYFGVSLGGIMGTFFSALEQRIIRYNVDVPAINFSVLEQRSTQFPAFLDLIAALGLTDPMDLALVLQVQHEIWASGEPAGYVRNITGLVDPPLPDTPAKKLLMTSAFLDLQVSNQASEIMARSLGIPSLVGSLQEQLPAIPDVDAGVDGLDSALVMYDTGFLDPFDPAFETFRPPLANRIVEDGKCDPHGGPRLSIPASVDQLGAFLQPGGKIFNFCTGPCDAQTPNEQPSGFCDVFAP